MGLTIIDSVGWQGWVQFLPCHENYLSCTIVKAHRS